MIAKINGRLDVAAMSELVNSIEEVFERKDISSSSDEFYSYLGMLQSIHNYEAEYLGNLDGFSRESTLVATGNLRRIVTENYL